MPRTILISLFVVASLASPSEAARIDQSYIPPAEPLLSSSVGSIGGGQKAEEAQTFVVGVSGQLTNVDLYLQGQGSGLLLEIVRTTASGAPSTSPTDLLGAAFASSTVSSNGYQFVSFQLGQLAPTVQAGDHLALVLVAPGSGYYDWGGSAGNPYPQGGLFTLSPFYNDQWSSPTGLGSGADLGFRTFVEPVPEPSTLATLVFGGSVLMLLAGRRVKGTGIPKANGPIPIRDL